MRVLPGYLGHARWCLVASGLALALAQPTVCHAQASYDTQQKANDRIQELAKEKHAPPRDYVIGRGDLMSVEVFDVPELSRDARVSQTGTIGLPLLPVRLFVAGLTELQVQQKIAEVLEANGLVSHPQVMVFVKDRKSKPIAVVGAVARPMVVQADRQLTLIEVLAEAGGIGQDASDVVLITRGTLGEGASDNEPPEIGQDEPIAAGNPSAAASESAPTPPSRSEEPPSKPADSAAPVKPIGPATAGTPDASTGAAVAPPVPVPLPPAANTISVNLADLLERGDTRNNINLEAGDVVTIPHAGIVYALGAVNRPGGYLARDDRAQLSTLKVLALAGGTTRVAKRGQAVIIRKDADGHQHSIPVDLGKVVKQQTEDVRLFPSDILYVPDSHTKAALLRTGEIALGVGTSLAIYRIGTH